MQKIFDAHFHVIDPKFPLTENNGFLPDPYTAEQYRKECQDFPLEFVGGTVVSGSFQGYDQSYFGAALSALGTDYVGVTQLPVSTTDEEILKLNKLGIRGIRFNLYRGLDTPLTDIELLAKRVYNLVGWGTEFYINLNTADDELRQLILKLPKTSIDHLGMTVVPIDDLYRFITHDVRIRVSGFGRIAYERDQVKTMLPLLYQKNPHSLMFGTDLPATRAKYRFSMDDIYLIREALSNDSEAIDDILYRNAQNWYL
ncbi:amidohydrolase family protein [Lacticaseibacillus baoqingensis]|uniref:Amidohydrolase family protein n=1 Tax=Lacticaseibacillus baoqingensis TaxID=2486013 RepID=A0ABW4E2X8_9LACO|nr:amidohydrolase family protein [Lacticaseibacillus baoqingensis]